MIDHSLSADELLRYEQQIKLPEVGLFGQAKLKNARVLCVGLGGLASSLLPYLAAAGVGKLGLIDDDCIELSNLQRQVIYRFSQVSKSKTASALEQILALNSKTQVDTYPEKLTRKNAFHFISQYDIVADCSDNFYTNYLIHDSCFLQRKPYVYASVSQFAGYCCLFNNANGGPCLRCLFPDPPDPLIPSCDVGGVLGVVPGLLGIIQATEIIKWILGTGDLLEKRLLSVDLKKMKFKEIKLSQHPDCQLCIHQHPLDKLSYPSALQCGVGLEEEHAITAEDLFKILQQPNVCLIDVRTAAEHQAHNIGGKLLPISELSARLGELNPQHTYILYCQTSKRSIQALTILLAAGFSSVKYLINGLSKSGV